MATVDTSSPPPPPPSSTTSSTVTSSATASTGVTSHDGGHRQKAMSPQTVSYIEERGRGREGSLMTFSSVLFYQKSDKKQVGREKCTVFIANINALCHSISEK